MSKKRSQKLITPEIMHQAIIGSFTKLNPRYMMKNPVMFVVEVGCFISLILSIFPSAFGDVSDTGNLRLYNIIVCVILFITVLFANFAESIAEGRGKAQAATLKKTQKDTKARLLLDNGEEKEILSSQLKKGDIVLVNAGEVIPGDGEVIEGIASVDESAITGESAPVVRESGGDFCSVTGGTTVVSDWLKIRIASDPGNSFLDRMIALVEGASRKKTPNEIALNTLLVSLTIIFLIVIVTLYPIGLYSGVQLKTSTLIALCVCLIPTTIGGLLSAIGIAGMDRVTRFNVIAMSGKAVEACGDVDTMILDNTGTITYGNRLAADFFPVGGADKEELIRCAALTSLTSPVNVTKYLPAIPLATRTSISSMYPDLTAASAASIALAAVNVSIIPNARLFFTSTAPWIASKTFFPRLPITKVSIKASSATTFALSTDAFIAESSPPTIVTYFPGHTEPELISVIPALLSISSVTKIPFDTFLHSTNPIEFISAHLTFL